jgi:hypothetical protein
MNNICIIASAALSARDVDVKTQAALLDNPLSKH